MKNNFFGYDIKLDDNMDVCLSVNGELILTCGEDTVFQDIKLRILTAIGSLFYDESYGSNFNQFIFDDDININSILSEVIRTVECDTRIEPYSVTASLIENTKDNISISITYSLINEDTSINKTISINKSIWRLQNA